MVTCDVGSPDPPGGVGKYDFRADEREEVWANFSRCVEALAHTLSDLPVTARMVRDVLGVSTLQQLVETMVATLNLMVQHFQTLAPAYHDRQQELHTCAKKLAQALDNIEDDDSTTDIRLRPIIAPLMADMRQAAKAQETFDINDELEACRASTYYNRRHRGIEQYIKATTETLKQQMMRRNEWQAIVEECAVAMDDQRLSELAHQTLRTKHFDALAQLLTVALIIREHRASRRKHSDREVTDAIRATLAEYENPSTQEVLGIWFAWKQLPGNKDGLQKHFTMLLPRDILGKAGIYTDANSQFCRRANDKYLIETAPSEWTITAWEKDGKQVVSRTLGYLNRMRAAAKLFGSFILSPPISPQGDLPYSPRRLS